MSRTQRMVALDQIKPNPRNARTYSKKQFRQIADSIKAFGFTTPVLIDESNMLLAGHGRVEAAKMAGLKEVPAIVLAGLSEAKKRALLLADNKIADNAGWDRERLAIELPELSELLIEDGLDLMITGFEPVEIDALHIDFEEEFTDPVDHIDGAIFSAPSVTSRDDVWAMGRHRLVCGDARSMADLNNLMGKDRAAMAFLDPPYNVEVKDIVGRGRVQYREFAMASGEMSAAQFTAFLNETLANAAKLSRDGALHYVCMDWRHLGELIQAGNVSYAEMVNLAVWVKSNAGQGSFYRSQHELVGVFRVGKIPHLNNVELGKHGRSRSNVWNYPGANTFRRGRMDDLTAHPTVKPTALVSDVMRDCTRRGDVVLDTFMGSGTTILAAERVGRRARGLEIDPAYVDVTVRRWQEFTGKDAVHAVTGLTFDETAAKRSLPIVSTKQEGHRDAQA